MYLVSAKMACKILRLSDVEGLAKTYLNAWKSGKVCCFHENCFPKRFVHLRVVERSLVRGRQSVDSPK